MCCAVAQLVRESFYGMSISIRDFAGLQVQVTVMTSFGMDTYTQLPLWTQNYK